MQLIFIYFHSTGSELLRKNIYYFTVFTFNSLHFYMFLHAKIIFLNFNLQLSIKETKNRMIIRKQKIEKIKRNMESVEDCLFQIEEIELVQNRIKMESKFDQEINKITSKLDYERTYDGKSKGIYKHFAKHFSDKKQLNHK